MNAGGLSGTLKDRIASKAEPGLSLKAKLYLGSIIGAGGAAFAYSLFQASALFTDRMVILTCLAVLTGLLTVQLPLPRLRRHGIVITFGDVFVFAAMFSGEPHSAVIISVIEGGIVLLRARGRSWRGQGLRTHYKQFFNLGQLALIAFLVGHFLCFSMEQAPGSDWGSDLTSLLAVALLSGALYFTLNSSVIAAAMSLVTQVPLSKIWTEHFKSGWVSHLSAALLGSLVYLAIVRSPQAVIIVTPSFLLIYYAFRTSRDRAEAAAFHVREVEDLLAQKTKAEQALQAANLRLESTVTERTADLSRSNQQLSREVKTRRWTERQLAQEKERLAATLRSIGEGVIACDNQGKVMFVNRVAEQLTGFAHQEAAGQSCCSILKLADPVTGEAIGKEQFLARHDGNQHDGSLSRSVLLLSKGGERHDISISVANIEFGHSGPLGMVFAFRDISYELQMEEEVRKTQKLESLGTLAGGLAHDFNNILAGILLKTGLATGQVRRGEDPTVHLESIQSASKEAASLTRQLLVFAKGGEPVRELVRIEDILRRSASFVLRGSRVLLSFDLPDELWPAAVDSGQIGQVVSNLVINAQESMPEGGRVLVGARNVRLGPRHGKGDLEPGYYLRIWVKDTGEGIAPDHVGRIFDPYFTTKSKGSGLGLAGAHSIIRKHGGMIGVRSGKGRGSLFYFYLPARRGEKPERALPHSPRLSARGKRILIMDDDSLIVEGLDETLRGMGCEVVSTGDGDEAVRVYQDALATHQPFDAVILDLTIPGGMGGSAAVKQLRKVDPGVRAVVSSGYSKAAEMSEYSRHGFAAFLKKPFSADDLARALQTALEPQAPEATRPSARA